MPRMILQTSIVGITITGTDLFDPMWCWYSGDLWSVRDRCLSCEINWLDPEPSRECSDYEHYVKELQDVQKFMRFYRGFHLPPTADEYNQLLDERSYLI